MDFKPNIYSWYFGECRFCFKSIDGRARICPYCQSEKPQKLDGLTYEEQCAVREERVKDDREREYEKLHPDVSYIREEARKSLMAVAVGGVVFGLLLLVFYIVF
tara:strand:- start:73 stop:384 length:312 start_codon:yes stop_codon:yes gene_type:complete